MFAVGLPELAVLFVLLMLVVLAVVFALVLVSRRDRG